MKTRWRAVAVLAALVFAGLSTAGCATSGSAGSTWAPLDSGKPAFYYFGAPS